jgi:hypothetical protein
LHFGLHFFRSLSLLLAVSARLQPGVRMCESYTDASLV